MRITQINKDAPIRLLTVLRAVTEKNGYDQGGDGGFVGQ